jgi:hypothetical protein
MVTVSGKMAFSPAMAGNSAGAVRTIHCFFCMVFLCALPAADKKIPRRAGDAGYFLAG